jgi:hypothetical protein
MYVTSMNPRDMKMDCVAGLGETNHTFDSNPVDVSEFRSCPRTDRVHPGSREIIARLAGNANNIGRILGSCCMAHFCPHILHNAFSSSVPPSHFQKGELHTSTYFSSPAYNCPKLALFDLLKIYM